MDLIIIKLPNPYVDGGFKLSSTHIEKRLAPDISSLVQTIPGFQVKNYGDIGGLKLASFRSFGANHTSVVLDDQVASQAQSGSTDLSSIPTEFISSIEIVSPVNSRVDVPISAKLNGSALLIQSSHSPYVYQQFKQFKASLQQGSFGLWSGELNAFTPWKKWIFNISGKYRSYRGEFPFTYMNGNTTISDERRNNGLQDVFGIISVKRTVGQYHKFMFLVAHDEAQKELPGAVVFYNNTANTHLSNQNWRGQFHHSWKKNKWEMTNQLNAFNNRLHYVDSNYLNAQGYLHQFFETNEINQESQIQYTYQQRLKVLLGNSAKFEQIVQSTLDNTPYRFINQSFNSIHFSSINSRVKLQFNQGLTTVFQPNNLNQQQQSFYLPSFAFQLQLNQHNFLLINVKKSLRLPTFSEIYYQSFHPLTLRPEQAKQGSLRYTFTKSFHFIDATLGAEPFFGVATDKIVAIPTQNTFIWSIVNLAKTQNLGVETYFDINKFTHNYHWGIKGAYTFQRCIDLSNEQASNYKHLITYAPQHTANLDLSFGRKKMETFIAMNYIGNRYALQNNTLNNLLPAIFQIDAGISRRIQMNTNSAFKVAFVVKNITDQYNQYIRYFVLPGINYQIKVSYEIR